MIRVVLGLGFGDEGKGSLVDWLARGLPAPPLVVRWNGGPQAAHHVVTDDGRTHCFAQLGSASFLPGARTHLGPEMAVDVWALHAEAAALARAGVPDGLATLTIDPRAVLVTPWHAIVNRLRELARGGGRHGTTGRGVAEAKLGALRVCAADIGPGLAGAVAPLRRELAATARALAGAGEQARELAARADDDDLLEVFVDAARRLEPAGARVTATPPAAREVILEGAQGALLDRDHGFFPHVTPSRITRAAAEAAARELGLAGELEVWGVLRAYHTRHGEGPFPSEDASLAARLPELHNDGAGWAGAFRVGWFDGVLARYALSFAGPIDRLALTCVDRLPEGRIVEAWSLPDGPTGPLAALPPAERTRSAARARPLLRPVAEVVAAVEAQLGRRVDVESRGPTAAGKIAR